MIIIIVIIIIITIVIIKVIIKVWWYSRCLLEIEFLEIILKLVFVHCNYILKPFRNLVPQQRIKN